MVRIMNKNSFLKKLSEELRGIPEEERKDILAEYTEHFEVGMAKGRSEKEISISIGNPMIIAKELKALTLVKIAERESSVINISRAAFSTLGLGVFNLIFVLVPLLIIFIILISLFAAAIGITALGIAVLIAILFEPLLSDYLVIGMKITPAIFLSISSIALGILFFIGNIQLVRSLYEQFLRYLKFNMRVIGDRRQKDEI